ncbi:unnamed protein product [Symbiodinium sp. KB8]|nr:unnamed protein product [Symbiodinium sp. KB8]
MWYMLGKDWKLYAVGARESVDNCETSRLSPSKQLELRKQEKKAARKEEKRNKRAEKSAKKVEKAEKAEEEKIAKKQKQIEDEANRIRAVEVSERRAKEQRAKQTSKVNVHVVVEKKNWFERKSTELVESFVQNCSAQSKKARDAETAHIEACRTLENSQSDFAESLQKVQDSAQQLQRNMALALERAIEHGEEQAKHSLFTLGAKQK